MFKFYSRQANAYKGIISIMLTKGWYRTALHVVSSPQLLVVMAHSAPIFIIAIASAASWLIEINGLPLNFALSKHKTRPRPREKPVCLKCCVLLMCALTTTTNQQPSPSKKENNLQKEYTGRILQICTSIFYLYLWWNGNVHATYMTTKPQSFWPTTHYAPI